MILKRQSYHPLDWKCSKRGAATVDNALSLGSFEEGLNHVVNPRMNHPKIAINRF
jgi:hypothetical protein